MNVVSNTSPLIGFAKIGRLNLLKQLFQRIMIPGIVYEEFFQACTPTEEQHFLEFTGNFISIINLLLKNTSMFTMPFSNSQFSKSIERIKPYLPLVENMVLALWVVAILIVTLHHELWRDEVRSILLTTEVDSLSEFISSTLAIITF